MGLLEIQTSGLRSTLICLSLPALQSRHDDAYLSVDGTFCASSISRIKTWDRLIRYDTKLALSQDVRDLLSHYMQRWVLIAQLTYV